MKFKFFSIKKIKIRASFILLILLSVFFKSTSYAIWMTREDTTHDINFYNKNIEINSDGTYSEITEIKVTLTKEDQPENIVTNPVTYNPEISKLTVLNAYTLFEGKKYIIKHTEIEDKSIASGIEGLTNIHQVLIKFPNVKKGSELYLKYILKVNKTIVPNLYANIFSYYFNGYLENSYIKLTSKIPLFLEKNEFTNILDIKETKTSGKQVIVIKTKKPYLKAVMNEQTPYLNFSEIPWVALSSYHDWKKVSKTPIEKYEKILTQKLPETFEEIANKASKKNTINEKIDTVTSLLAEKVKYKGDWRSLESSFFPKNLSEIAHTGQGDCKDYAISTVAILRKIGISANVAAIYRADYNQDFPFSLPNLNLFNHLLVQVTHDGKVNWVDPTHFASFSDGLFSDISNRKALVFNPNKPGIEKTPALTSNDSQIIINETQDYSVKNQLIKEGEIELKGNSVVLFTGATLKASKEIIDREILNYRSKQNNLLSWKIEDYNLDSRIVTNKSFKYKIIEKPYEIKTDLGIGYSLDSISNTIFYTKIFLINTLNRKSDLFIESPSKLKSKILLKNIFRVKKKYTGCQVKSKWATFSRNILDNKTGVEIIDDVSINYSHLLNKDIVSSEFKEFQDQIESCINGIVIIASSDKYIG